MKRALFRSWMAAAALSTLLLTGCYGAYGPEGVQPYGVPATGAVLPAPGQEIQHEYGRSCFIECEGKSYLANCPNEVHAVCQCTTQPYAECK